MPYSIDSTSDKANHYPLNHGYDARGVFPSSIVVHSTEGGKGQSLESAAAYLFTSAKVSAHYLIGRTNEIIQFLDPKQYSAWHAGVAEAPFVNQRSIGIECLHSQGELWPNDQKATLAWLLQYLSTRYTIPAHLIDTHGQIAIPGPYQRKIDPTNWPHDEFKLFVADALTPQPMAVRIKGLPIYQQQSLTGPLAGHFASGEIVEIDVTYPNGAGHDKLGRGFIDLDGTEPV